LLAKPFSLKFDFNREKLVGYSISDDPNAISTDVAG